MSLLPNKGWERLCESELAFPDTDEWRLISQENLFHEAIVEEQP